MRKASSPAYLKRLARGIARGLSPSQAAGKPRKTELPARAQSYLNKVGPKNAPNLVQAERLAKEGDFSALNAVKSGYAKPVKNRDKVDEIISRQVSRSHQAEAKARIGERYLSAKKASGASEYYYFIVGKRSRWWIMDSEGSTVGGPYRTKKEASEALESLYLDSSDIIEFLENE